jgi:predicted ester cyclase
MMVGMYERMPGIKVTIEDIVAEGDKVVCRNVWRWRGEGNTMEFRGSWSGASRETRSPSAGPP